MSPWFVYGQPPGEIRISATFTGTRAIELLNDLEKQYPVRFYYKEEWFSQDILNVTFRDNTLEEAVNMILSGKPYTFRIINQTQVILMPRQKWLYWLTDP